MASENEEEKLLKVEYLAPHLSRKSEVATSLRTFYVKIDSVSDVKQDRDAPAPYHLQAILFDEKYGSFVGNTWNGKPVKNDATQITFNQNFYFYTSIPVSDLLLIIELITPSQVPNRFKTCGWMGIPLAEKDEDKGDEKSTAYYKVPLIHGSPISLIPTFEETRRKAKKKNKKKNEAEVVEKMTGMEISLSRSSCPQLLQMANFVPENILLDSSFQVPGLVSHSFQVSNNKINFKPQLQPSITFVLENLRIRTSLSLEAVENEIVEKFLSYLDYVAESTNSANNNPKNGLQKISIVQRRLQVGIHNGYCFIQEPGIYHLHALPSSNPAHPETLRRSVSTGALHSNKENGLVMQSDIKLKIPDDPNIAVVFLLEYIMNLPNAKEQSISSSWSKSPTANISIAWGFCYLKDLKENPYHHAILTCDSTYSPHTIFFLKTEEDFVLTCSAISLLKQSKEFSASFLPEPTTSVISTSNGSETSAKTQKSHPFLSHSKPKHKSIADIPMTVQKNEAGSSRTDFSGVGLQKNEQNLALQEVTLVPSSLPLVPPLLHSFPLEPGESFKTFSKLYWDKLNPVLDHNGKPAISIDSSVPYKINADLELGTPPQISECMLQLLAISSFEEFVEIPNEVYCTFQFYRFLPIRSENLVLKPLSENVDDMFPKSSLVYALHKTRGKDKIPGFQVTYNIDPSELNKGEYRYFLKYLMKQTLHVDLWNGTSLLYFGTVALPLKYFCRQGKEAVYSDLELDIFNCEFLDESLGQENTPIRTPMGRLHLRLASIRHPLSSKALDKMEDKEMKTDSVVICSKKENSATDASSFSISKARRIVETDRELSKLLSTRCVRDNSENMSPDPHLTEERRRKLARMEAVRNLENNKNVNNFSSGNEIDVFKEKQRDWLSIESYIAKNKSELIQSFLHTSVTSEKMLYPVAGKTEFFEFVIENPYQEAKKVEIIWKCPELCLVTENKLWQLLRNLYSMSQKVKQLVYVDASQETPTILLQPKEKVHVPFTYQCLTNHTSQLDLFKAVSGHHFSVDILSSVPVLNSLDSSVKVKFMTEDQVLLAVLNLKIQPLPPSFTHTFKFLSMEHSMFKKSIQINNDGTVSDKVTVACSHPEIVCTIPEPQDLEENMNVHIKASTKSAGKCIEFCVFIYKDNNRIALLQTWRISIYPLQRIDLSCIAGQLMRSSLLIRGTHATNLVRCSSSSKELQLHPSDPFVLSPFAVQELSMNIRSLMPGIKHFQISMVNEALELTLQSWLLVLSCQKPTVSKAFQVHLSIGKEAAKRITYTNPYPQERRYVLRTSHPHLLRLRESRFSAASGLSYCLGLYFLPQDFAFTETVFLYLNDAAADKNEETYCIKVLCH